MKYTKLIHKTKKIIDFASFGFFIVGTLALPFIIYTIIYATIELYKLGFFKFAPIVLLFLFFIILILAVVGFISKKFFVDMLESKFFKKWWDNILLNQKNGKLH